MARKLSHDEVFNYYSNEKYIMNSIYNGSKNKDSLICPVGHEIKISFDNFKRGKRCAKCSGNEKLSQEYVFNYYKEYNYILKSTYNGNKIKNILLCPEGHNIQMIFSDFKRGKRCLKCSGLEKHSHEFVFNYYSNENYVMKSIYINSRIKNILICPEGHQCEISHSNFKKGHRCNFCYKEKNRGKNHPNWITDRTRLRRANNLSFDLTKVHILKDDPNYEQYLILYEEANIERNKGNIHYKTKMSVDHIFPRKSIIDNNLDIIYGVEVCKKIINLRENLRIIYQKDNVSKGGKYNQDHFLEWFNKKINDTQKLI